MRRWLTWPAAKKSSCTPVPCRCVERVGGQEGGRTGRFGVWGLGVRGWAHMNIHRMFYIHTNTHIHTHTSHTHAHAQVLVVHAHKSTDCTMHPPPTHPPTHPPPPHPPTHKHKPVYFHAGTQEKHRQELIEILKSQLWYKFVEAWAVEPAGVQLLNFTFGNYYKIIEAWAVEAVDWRLTPPFFEILGADRNSESSTLVEILKGQTGADRNFEKTAP
jgi:hypothetical protein